MSGLPGSISMSRTPRGEQGVVLFAIAAMSVPQSDGLVEPLCTSVQFAPPSVER